MSNQEEWNGYGARVLELLNTDAEFRIQALNLLDSLVDEAREEGQQAVFNPIFTDINFSTQMFGWMTELHRKMRWSQKGNFMKEDIFWPLFDLYVRLYPEKKNFLLSTMQVRGTESLPSFLKEKNSVQNLIIGSYVSLEGILELDVSTLSFVLPYSQFQNHQDLPSLLEFCEGKGDFRIVAPKNSALVLEEIQGKREIKIATGDFALNAKDISLTQLPYVQILDFDFQDIDEDIWKQKHPSDSIDLGFAKLYLGGNKTDSLAQRLQTIHIKRLPSFQYWEDYFIEDGNDDLLKGFLGSQKFPLLTDIILSPTIDENDWYEFQIRITPFLLRKCPQLKTIYAESHAPILLEIHEKCWNTIHPLQNIYLASQDSAEIFLFQADSSKTLSERLTSISTSASRFIELIEITKNVSHLHLFGLGENLSIIKQCQNLEFFDLEASLGTLVQWKDDFIDAQVLAHVQEIIEDKEDSKYFELLDFKSNQNHRVNKISDIIGFVENSLPFSTPKEFINTFKEMVKNQALPEHFTSWLKTKSSIRLGQYSVWMDGDKIKIKRYESSGYAYLKALSSPWAYTVNLERYLLGKTAQNLPVFKQRVLVYNNSSIPLLDVANKEVMPKLTTVKIETETDFTDILGIKKLKVLYLNDLGLTELPSSIKKLKKLEELYLWGNKLTSLPKSLEKMEKLWRINVSGNPFTDITETLKILLKLPIGEQILFRGAAPHLIKMFEKEPALAQDYFDTFASADNAHEYGIIDADNPFLLQAYFEDWEES